MTFLSPWAFWFLAGIPVIVALYLLRVRRRGVEVSTLLFWQRVLQENRRRALFQKLRQVLSLLLHLLIFLLLVLALAKPEWGRLLKNGASTVLVLDARQRSQAADAGGVTRFERARRELRGVAARASARNEMALVVMRDGPEVAAAFTGDAKLLREALDRLAPTDCAGDMKSAEEFAARLLASRTGGRHTVISDGNDGTPQDNAAITRFAARAVPASPQTSDVLLEVRNFGAHALKANVEVWLDGRLLDVKPVELEPGAASSQTFPVVPQPALNARGWLTAHLDARDALAADNDAFAVLPRLEPVRVLLVTPGNFFLEKALAANPLFRFELLPPDAFKPGVAAGFDAVIFDGTMPAGFVLENTPGNFLFIRRTPFDEPGAAAVEHPLVSETDERSPLLRMVNLDAVTFLRAAPLKMPGPRAGWRFAAPVQAFDRPLIVTGSSGTGRAAAFAFDVAESDLPLRVAFPLLVANTLQWLAGEKFDAPSQVAAGEIVELGEKRAVCPDALRDFNSPVPDAPEKFSAHALRPLRDGFYATRGEAGAGWLAVNTFSAEESDLRAQTLAQPQGVAESRAPSWRVADFFNWPPWMFCALAALALFAWEWRLFHRRKTE